MFSTARSNVGRRARTAPSRCCRACRLRAGSRRASRRMRAERSRPEAQADGTGSGRRVSVRTRLPRSSSASAMWRPVNENAPVTTSSASSALHGVPDLFAGPLARPLRGHVAVVRVRLRSSGAKISRDRRTSKPVSRRSRIHSPCPRWNSTAAVRPGEAVHAALRSLQTWCRPDRPRRASKGSRACCCEEDEPSTGAEQPVRLGDPAIRVAPDARAVLREREVEARIGKPGRHGVCLDAAETRDPSPPDSVEPWRVEPAYVDADGSARRAAPARPRSSRCRIRARRRPDRRRRREPPRSRSGTPHMPQLDLLLGPVRRRLRVVYSAFAFVQSSRFARASCDRSAMGLDQAVGEEQLELASSRSPASRSRARRSRRGGWPGRPGSSRVRRPSGASSPSARGHPRSRPHRGRRARAPGLR